MTALQILSKVILTSDNSIIEDNQLTAEYFVGYEQEFDFLQAHIEKYGNVPDKATFLSKFPSVELVEVTESDKYLIDSAREEYLYYKSVPVIQKAAELLKSDSNAAAEYLINAMRDLQPDYNLGGVNIIADAKLRYQQFLDRREHQQQWFFTSGFNELDDIIHGIQREEELMVIFARTNQGKSWILEKMCTRVWQDGFNVGYISPEMSANSIGYRFDTLNNHYSNKGLMWGKHDIDEVEYGAYIEGLSQCDGAFVVATPADFQKQITVTKLKNWIKKNKLDMVAVDGITYMTDERYKRGDNKTTSLTNISEDLMELSVELHVPVLVVVQANRTGVTDKGSDDTPELESIRDSDGIAQNASKVLSIHQKEGGVLNMTVKKQRFGPVGGKLSYTWNIDTGEFLYLPSYDDPGDSQTIERNVEEVKKKYADSTSVF